MSEKLRELSGKRLSESLSELGKGKMWENLEN